ncbi:MAG TPA: bifunctional hydroxymethylpyrimidine kinase/phosphomethylpyrimidine kinase [Nitrospinota bacterium]|nr:bifunctional hydroxymethylpyrimidine kinase/phosphomethylpyrimidine kinase [Nitrospinota bacterium]
MKVALTIAGSDSGGGAGIQADLKTFSALGVFGTSAITSLTAQNTIGVEGIFDISPDFVGLQIDAVAKDIGVDAAKTGMLSSSEIVIKVSEKIKEHKIKKLVVDPVMVAKSGDHLLRTEAKEALITKLLPLAYVITPNTEEAKVLTGINIKSIQDMKRAARKIVDWGIKNVVIKGGHLTGNALDLFYNGKEFIEYSSERIKTKNTHGTGCTFSAAITAELAKGNNLKDAIRTAKDYITTAIRYSLDIGKGHGPTHHFSNIYREIDRYHLVEELGRALEKLKKEKIGKLIPEVQSNFGLALPFARDYFDIIAFPGRIIRFGDEIRTLSSPRFGASRHVANIILTVLKYDPEKRAVMNICYSKEAINTCKRLRMKISSFNRKEEPKRIKTKEGSSLEWGTETAIKRFGSVPDIIYDLGGHEKEAMIRVIGKNANDVVDKIINIKKGL